MTIEATRRSYLMMDPDDIKIVGLDVPAERSPKLATPVDLQRLALPLDPALVENIKLYGVIKPAMGETDGDDTLCVDGRRRILHAREAKRQGVDVKVPVIMRRGTAASMFGLARSANRFAVEDSPIMNAQAAQAMLDMGASEATVATTFGVQQATIQEWTRLLDLSPEVQEHVHSGEVGVNAGLALAELPKAEQAPIVEAIRSNGHKPSAERVVNAVRAAKGKAPSLTPKHRVERAQEALYALAKLGAAAPKEAITTTLNKLSLALASKKWDSLVASLHEE